jgi:enoyl-CoA hydratase
VPVDVERRDAVAIITLNRPEALNALSPEMLDDLEARLAELDAESGVRAIVITGAGEKAFCAGADIGHMRTASPLEAQSYARRGHALTRRVATLPTPVVAAVNGYALGGGCELALACDIRLAADTARFGQPEITLGIIPGWGGTQRLARATSPAFAKELILTGRPVKADEALRVGLVNHVHPVAELRDAAVAMGEMLAARPAWTLAAAKAVCNLATESDLEAHLAREADVFALTFATPEQREGMDAFFEKRAPDFTGVRR